MDLFFFDIRLLYYYTNLDLSINCCLFSGDIYLSFGISSSLLTASKLLCEVFEIFVFFQQFITS